MSGEASRVRVLGAADMLQVVPVQLQLLLQLEVELAHWVALIRVSSWLQRRQPLLEPQTLELRGSAWCEHRV